MKNKKVHLLFFFLLLYILLQSIWWMFNIFELSTQLYTAEQMGGKKWMIFGEGAVFLFILLLSFLFAIRTLQKDLNLSQQQKNFLMAVSHELKTPIASIKLYLQTLLKRKLDTDKQEDIISKSLLDTDRLNNLVESILLTTKIEDHAVFLNLEELNLSSVTEQTTLKVMESSKKPMDFEFFIEENIVLQADENAMTSIISNLVSNAIKYSPEQSTITVTLKRENQTIQLSVSDQGTGIPTDQRNKIFDKFYRIGDENTRKQQGTGLGLFIVKYLTEQHQGSVNVQKNSPKGAIFTCTFN